MVWDKERVVKGYVKKIICEDPQKDKDIPYKMILISGPPMTVQTSGIKYCRASAAWYQVNIMKMVECLLEKYEVPAKRHELYTEVIYEFYDILRKTYNKKREKVEEMVEKYVIKKMRQQVDLRIVVDIGQMVFYLQRERRRFFR